MEKMLRSLSAKSDTAGAIRYAHSHWRPLIRYVEDGLLEIDNSAAERALRAVSIGRKNCVKRDSLVPFTFAFIAFTVQSVSVAMPCR